MLHIVEARNKLEEERHRKKMEEQKAKDAEFIKKQQEKAEKKAAIEMEKERKLEAEQKQAAQSLLTKIQKNQGEYYSGHDSRRHWSCQHSIALVNSFS